jgi:hypothetical protein
MAKRLNPLSPDNVDNPALYRRQITALKPYIRSVRKFRYRFGLNQPEYRLGISAPISFDPVWIFLVEKLLLDKKAYLAAHSLRRADMVIIVDEGSTEISIDRIKHLQARRIPIIQLVTGDYFDNSLIELNKSCDRTLLAKSILQTGREWSNPLILEHLLDLDHLKKTQGFELMKVLNVCLTQSAPYMGVERQRKRRTARTKLVVVKGQWDLPTDIDDF